MSSTRSESITRGVYHRRMCRNIRVLHNFEPPTTVEEMRDAALQYVRKVSGIAKPTAADEAAFLSAVEQVTEATRDLLAGIARRGSVRTRDGEREKAKARWKKREVRMTLGSAG